jgi:deoxyribodipyrimidine photo-lyase
MTSLWWIRRDLRLSDNPALQAALEAGPILPVFLLDPAFAHSSPRRRDFLFEGLHALDRGLRSCVSSLVIGRGDPDRTLLAYRLAKEAMYA